MNTTDRIIFKVVGSILAAMALGILAASAWAGPSLEKCKKRCDKLYFDEPTPVPPPPPTRTLGKACDYFVTSARTITFPVSATEPTVLCVDPPAASTPFVELATQNHGNASCADYWLQMYSPTGAVSEPSTGAQPGAIMARIPGRYYAVVYLRSANNVQCQTLTVYVR